MTTADPTPAEPDLGTDDPRHLHALRESVTMALYLTISLLALLAARPHGEEATGPGLGVVWGTVAGLTLAHWLAFRLSGRLFAGSPLTAEDRATLKGQAMAALGVAVLASIPFLVFEPPTEQEAAGLVLAGLIGLFTYGTARRNDASPLRSLVSAVSAVAVAAAIAIVKNVLAGH